MKLKNYLIVGLVGVLTLFSSCADKIYEGDNVTNINGALIFSDNFDIPRNEFIWNSNYNRFEYVLDHEDITDEVFDNGIVYSTIYIDELADNGTVYQTQKSLTFSRKFPFPAGSNQWYNEIISADITPGTISFYIEGLKETDRSVLMDVYTFKVSIVWDGSN